MARQEEKHEGGAVLLIVLIITLLLALFAVQAMRTMQVDLRSATFYQGTVEAEFLALSGLEYAQALLAEDADRKDENGNIINADHLHEPWANTHQIAPSTFASGRVEFSITDECGLFPINSLHNTAWRQAFIKLLDDLLEDKVPFQFERTDICNKLAWRLADWQDEDGKPNPAYGREVYSAADSGPHEGIAIRTKNANLAFVNELREFLLLQDDLADEAGMELDEFVATLYNPTENEAPETKNSLSSRPDGLQSLLTTHGNEKININTAPGIILKTLFSGEEHVVEAFMLQALEYRELPENEDKLEKTDWLQTVKKNSGLDVSWQHDMMQVKSDSFSVRSTGLTPKGGKQALAFLVRAGQSGKRNVAVTYRELYVHSM
jgi:hypothetical protein